MQLDFGKGLKHVDDVVLSFTTITLHAFLNLIVMMRDASILMKSMEIKIENKQELLKNHKCKL